MVMCVRESSLRTDSIGTGRAKEALHMHYVLSVIFGHFFQFKIIKFNFKKLSGG